MPNWCYTTIHIDYDDEEKLKEFDDLLDKWTDFDFIPNGFGLQWLGNIVGNSKIGEVEDNKSPNYLKCRGTLCDVSLTGNTLSITTETAWEPMLKMWTKLVDKYLPGAELTYYAEELGCGILATNDETYRDKYWADIWDGLENIVFEADDSLSEKCIIEMLQLLLDEDSKDIEYLLGKFNESDFSDGMSIHKWNINPITVWN